MQATNKEQSIRIQSSGGLSNDQVEQMVRDGEQYAEADKTRKAMIEARNEAETSIYSSEKSLSEYKDKIPQVHLPQTAIPFACLCTSCYGKTLWNRCRSVLG